MSSFAISAQRLALDDVPDDVLDTIAQAKASQLEALRFARLAVKQWRRAALMLDVAGAPIDQAAEIMGVTPRRISELLEE